MIFDYRLGRWEDVLSDVECDAVITDPPYGLRTHVGFNAIDPSALRGNRSLSQINYSHWTPEDVDAFVKHWSPKTRGWIVALTSHDLAPAWESAFAESGRMPFAPIPCVTIGGSVRFSGDGPSSWTVWAMVARPKGKHFATWGTLPGAYVLNRDSEGQSSGGGGRGKPLSLLRQLVRDYSRPGDVVVDPCGGLATTGVAAITMSRSFVGSEVEPEIHAKGLMRLRSTPTVDLFTNAQPEQTNLF